MAKQRLEAELGLNTQEFNKGLDKAKESVSGLANEFLTMGAGLGAATYALRQIVNAFLETEQGARVASQATAVFKQLWVELGNLNRINLANIILAGRAAKEAAVLREGDREDLLDQKRIQTDINKLMFEAAGESNDEKKKKILQEIIRLQEGLTIMMNVDAQQELKNLYAQLATNTENTKVLDAIAKKKLEILDIEGRMVEARRIQSQITAIEVQQQDKMLTNLEALKNKNKVGGKILGDIYPGILNMPSLKEIKPQIDPMTEALRRQQETLVGLAGTFAGFFSDVNLGFQGMIEGMVTGIKRLVMELAAKAAILAILSVITGVPMAGNFLSTLFGGNMMDLFTGGMNYSPSIVPAAVSGGIKMPEMGFKIYNRDLKLAIRR
jgi:hypothetical protein